MPLSNRIRSVIWLSIALSVTGCTAVALKTGVVIVVAAGATGAVYEQVELARDARLAPPPNEMVNLDGRNMHMVCAGDGPQTFVLDAGLGSWSLEWWRLQPLLAKTGRTCAFDRAGLGWSDPSGTQHDGIAAADDLARLVRAAKIPTPFVYVGHSLGANFAQIYYSRHPGDVSALVLIEPGNPNDLLEDFHGTRSEAMAQADCDSTCDVVTVAAYLGVTRLVAHNAGSHHFSGHVLEEYRVGLARPSFAATAVATYNSLPKTAYEDMDVQSFGAMPVLVLASSEPRKPEGGETIEDVKKWRVQYMVYLASLASKSSQGKGPIEIPDSDHISIVSGDTQSAATAKTIIDFLSIPQVRH